ncbi:MULTISPECIES: DUF2835 domain-containing protein [Ectothiorhodospira]|uniref:DUF2835 domain-containing protein n=1 Tax=Ectothiorhodospira marina TaxID=1396821 RepID=A0A1H7RCY7_9GAMM|nr:DUF2835 domain-containing protein [Ectothiorhodospira marina]MCG5515315.1 DUF2835 domain-containing protein [Ectothiorhodospira sp. 9100]MCG5519404.1 DUF2835 domain-containing protein [Ectothiorhodospira sp. 9905]SEL58200.1 Protein of unknown function [Ectothiorhodospira marina]
MHHYHFRLDIPRDEFLRYYSGSAASVVASSQEGRTVRFPASALRPHVTHDGVRGRFRLTVDDQFRLQSLERIGTG